MKEKFNQLVDKFKKTASDCSSHTLTLMKLKVFKTTLEDFQKLDNQKELHDFLLKPSDDIDAKRVSEVLFRLIFKDEFHEICDKIRHADFVKYHEKYPNATSLDYFFKVAAKFMKKQEREKIIKDSIEKVMEKGELVGRVKGEISMVQFLIKNNIDQEKIKNDIQFLSNKRYIKSDLEEILGYIKCHNSDDITKIYEDLGFSKVDDFKISEADYMELSGNINAGENI